MDYNKIENLVTQAKLGDEKSKETLAAEFTPLILNLSKKSFINSYEFADIKNECYKTLFKCVNVYNCENHRFVAYATNALKNTINNLIRISNRRASSEGPGAFILDGNLEHTLYSETEDIDELLSNEFYIKKLDKALKLLSFSDRELVDYVYYRNHTLKSYSLFKDIPYSTAVQRKNSILQKLKKALNNNSHITSNTKYLN